MNASQIASALGRLARGKPKRYSQAERRRRAARLALVRYRGGRKPETK